PHQVRLPDVSVVQGNNSWSFRVRVLVSVVDSEDPERALLNNQDLRAIFGTITNGLGHVRLNSSAAHSFWERTKETKKDPKSVEVVARSRMRLERRDKAKRDIGRDVPSMLGHASGKGSKAVGSTDAPRASGETGVAPKRTGAAIFSPRSFQLTDQCKEAGGSVWWYLYAALSLAVSVALFLLIWRWRSLHYTQGPRSASKMCGKNKASATSLPMPDTFHTNPAYEPSDDESPRFHNLEQLNEESESRVVVEPRQVRHKNHSVPILKFSYPYCDAYFSSQEQLKVTFQNNFAAGSCLGHDDYNNT
ncbi:hypothetical protein HPB47_001851, partial [Ixodes persulcatus]